MSIMETFKSDLYDDGRTKQSFKDETDINKILSRAAQGKTISHLQKHEGVYGDFSDIDDLMTAHERLRRGTAIFDELPGEVKREFHNDPRRFFNFVNDPANAGNLAEVLPDLAKPGTQMPTPVRRAVNQPQPETPPAPVEGSSEAPTEPPASSST